MKIKKGFILIELMIVISMIGILAAVAIPSYHTYTLKAHVMEPMVYAGTLKKDIDDFYKENLAFPQSNTQARLPSPDKLISNKISKVEIVNGAIHVLVGNKAPLSLRGKYLTFRPAVVDGSPISPISWLCGYAKPVNGMTAIGENKTDIDLMYLPSECVN